MQTVRILETFVSLQGESTYAGCPCFFIRLAGCNLHCRYCDTPNVYADGIEMPVTQLVDEFRGSGMAMAEITGGEPLLQPGVPALAADLRDQSLKPVLVETNGSLDISVIPDRVIAVMDLKCPGSGEQNAMDLGNLSRLRPYDEVKFVIADRADFDWAAGIVNGHGLDARCRAVLFSSVFGVLDAGVLGRWILEERLPVRLQVQWHKVLGMK